MFTEELENTNKVSNRSAVCSDVWQAVVDDLNVTLPRPYLSDLKRLALRSSVSWLCPELVYVSTIIQVLSLSTLIKKNSY